MAVKFTKQEKYRKNIKKYLDKENFIVYNYWVKILRFSLFA